jgi:hypothetical protein
MPQTDSSPLSPCYCGRYQPGHAAHEDHRILRLILQVLLLLLLLVMQLVLHWQAHPAPAAAGDSGVGCSSEGPPCSSTPAHASTLVGTRLIRYGLGLQQEGGDVKGERK